MLRITHKKLQEEGFVMEPNRYEKKHPKNPYHSFQIKDFKRKLREELYIVVTFTYTMKVNWTLTDACVHLIDGQESIPFWAKSWEEIKKVIDQYKDGEYQGFKSIDAGGGSI